MPAMAAGVEAKTSVIARLYKEYAWEAIFDTAAAPSRNWKTLLDEKPEILVRFFDDALTRLIVEDRNCRQRTHEICRLDYEPIWASQDPAATDLRISPGQEPSMIVVAFGYPGDKRALEVTYRMSLTRRGWRIADVLGPGGLSLLATLSARP